MIAQAAAREPVAPDTERLVGPALLFAFSLAAVGAGAGRALTTTYLPVLLERIDDAPSLIGAVMTINAVAGFAVPIWVGIWSDRRGRRLPYIVGGTALTAGGLVAMGLGNGSSYLALALTAGLVYTGLNALTTAHRAIVAEDFEDGRRPVATSAQELAGLVGAVIAVAIGASADRAGARWPLSRWRRGCSRRRRCRPCSWSAACVWASTRGPRARPRGLARACVR